MSYDTASPRTSLPIVTLTTDFGLRDPYVAAMKGVLCDFCPELRMVDLSHEIPPQDILEGALFLAGAIPFFPRGAIHVAVIDPGVGTERHPIIVRADGHTIICPDNGLPTLFVREHPIEEVRLIQNPDFMRDEISATFHGRDIFAPAAACLAAGIPLHEAGPEIDVIVTLDLPHPRGAAGGPISGEIIHVDRFGNLVSNIHRSLIPEEFAGAVTLGACRLEAIHRTYADVLPGEPVALFGSTGYLEVAVHGASASERLSIPRGESIAVRPLKGG